ncbi:unnamed protein product [Blepharisma stoltei]|uniref:Serine aminopeptidase S33 domain-containing protein n=1 Tax=Blepharisma stoltei TaxID=1481888 RepID=A0AAU9IGY4_9CILI|nr:unnamed protein product [Blepharisma stoltei]
MSEWFEKYQGIIACAGVSFPEENWLELESSQGIKLHTFRYHIENPRALVFIFHCYMSASSSFSHFAHKFAQSNFASFAFDQEGHGKSGGARAEVRDINENVSLGVEFIQKTKEQYPEGLPVFIIGESMGGLTCIGISLRIPDVIKGMILLAPALGTTAKVFSQFWTDEQVDPNDMVKISSNPKTVEWWIENPDTYLGKASRATGDEFTRAINDFQQQAPNAQTPFILFHGDHDEVVPIEASRQFFQNSGAADKEFAYDESLYHIISLEPQIPQILERVVGWIQARI